MEAFAFLKFWKSNRAKVAAGAGDCDGEASDSPAKDDYEDDSFFELELTLPNYDSKFPNPDLCSKSNQNLKNEIERKPSSKSKVIPITKPQSPISFLRSASPKHRVFTFGKMKNSKQNDEFETESNSSSSSSSYSSNSFAKQSDLSSFTVKFKIEDGSIVPKFTRSNSSEISRSSDECYASSKRFSIDAVQKYLNRIKPRYAAKSTKKCCESEKFAHSPARSSVSSYTPVRKEREEKQGNRFKVRCKQLRKSKSASEMIGSSSPAIFPASSEHPQDGIESAILHCKRSLSSSNSNNVIS